MKIPRIILALIATVFTIGAAQATPITGMLNISGSATFNNTHLGSATSVTAFNNVTVGLGNTGVFTAIASGTAVAMASPYIFNPSTPTPALWSVGGFTFDLQSSAIVTQTNTILAITGAGMIVGNGFAATPGVWAFTSQNAAGRPHTTFTFSANSEAVPGVPDGGMTLMLLGTSLVGIAVFRAKFATPTV